MSDIQLIAVSVSDLAAPGMKPKDLIAAVRQRHPEASKKQIVRAAFYAVITQADGDLEKAKRIQDVAIAERSAGEGDRPAKTKARRKAKQKPAS